MAWRPSLASFVLVILGGCDFDSTSPNLIAESEPLPAVLPAQQQQQREHGPRYNANGARRALRADAALKILQLDPGLRTDMQTEFVEKWLGQIHYEIAQELHAACEGSPGRANDLGQSKREGVATRLEDSLLRPQIPDAMLVYQGAQLLTLLEAYPGGDTLAARNILWSLEQRLGIRGW